MGNILEKDSVSSSKARACWNPTPVEGKENTYNLDAVLDAFNNGKMVGFDHGVSDMHRAVQKLLKNNVTYAASATDKVLVFLQEKNLLSKGAYMKITSWDEFDIMVLVQEDSYLMPTFKNVYDVVFEIEDLCDEEKLSLNFTFAPYNQDFNLACLKSDGFTIPYNVALPQGETASA